MTYSSVPFVWNVWTHPVKFFHASTHSVESVLKTSSTSTKSYDVQSAEFWCMPKWMNCHQMCYSCGYWRECEMQPRRNPVARTRPPIRCINCCSNNTIIIPTTIVVQLTNRSTWRPINNTRRPCTIMRAKKRVT